MKIIFLPAAIDPERPIQQAKPRKDVSEGIVDPNRYAQLGRYQEKDAKTKDDHPHPIIQYRPPQLIRPLPAVPHRIQFIFIPIHNNPWRAN
jgi:hypothetical protein